MDGKKDFDKYELEPIEDRMRRAEHDRRVAEEKCAAAEAKLAETEARLSELENKLTLFEGVTQNSVRKEKKLKTIIAVILSLVAIIQLIVVGGDFLRIISDSSTPTTPSMGGQGGNNSGTNNNYTPTQAELVDIKTTELLNSSFGGVYSTDALFEAIASRDISLARLLPSESGNAFAFHEDGGRLYYLKDDGRVLAGGEQMDIKTLTVFLKDPGDGVPAAFEGCKTVYLSSPENELAFALAIKAGINVTLTSSVTLTREILVTNDVTVNLEGAVIDASSIPTHLFLITSGRLKVIATGATVKCGWGGFARLAGDGEVDIYGGSYTAEADGSALVSVAGSGENILHLNEVKYQNTSDSGYIVNIENETEAFGAHIMSCELSAAHGLQLCGSVGVSDSKITGKGAAVVFSSGVFDIRDCEVESGGMYLDSIYPSSIYACSGADVTVKNCNLRSEQGCHYAIGPSGGRIQADECDGDKYAIFRELEQYPNATYGIILNGKVIRTGTNVDVGVAYSIDGTSCTVTGIGSCTDPHVTIPPEINGYPVTAIADSAFYNCTSLESITIPESVTSIGDSAFHYCTSLTSITIPDSVTSIGKTVLYGCQSLTSVELGDGVTSIGELSFENCLHLTDVKLGNGVTSIGKRAFCYCESLESITIPDGVKSIDEYAFRNCTSLTSITVPDSVTSVGSEAFFECKELTSVKIGDGVTSIGDNAFNDCISLTSITVGKGVTSVGVWAFAGCESLTEINFNATAMNDLSNSEYVFAYAGKGSDGITVNIGANVTKIPAYLFCPYSYDYSCSPKITEVKLEEGSVCESIGDYAFRYCTSLKSITIPESVTSIEAYAFSKCDSLTDVYYSGSPDEWERISKDSGNDVLSDATVYYNYSA